MRINHTMFKANNLKQPTNFFVADHSSMKTKSSINRKHLYRSTNTMIIPLIDILKMFCLRLFVVFLMAEEV